MEVKTIIDYNDLSTAEVGDVFISPNGIVQRLENIKMEDSNKENMESLLFAIFKDQKRSEFFYDDSIIYHKFEDGDDKNIPMPESNTPYKTKLIDAILDFVNEGWLTPKPTTRGEVQLAQGKGAAGSHESRVKIREIRDDERILAYHVNDGIVNTYHLTPLDEAIIDFCQNDESIEKGAVSHDGESYVWHNENSLHNAIELIDHHFSEHFGE